MTNGQDHGWKPQQGYGPQNGQGQAGQYDPSPNQQRAGGPQPPYPPPGMPWQQTGHGQPPANPPTQVFYGPPGGPQGRKPWPARHKVLTGFLLFCGLLFIIGIAAAAGSSSSSTPVPAGSSLTAKAPVVTSSPPATQTVATAPPTPAQTTPAPSTQAQTTAPRRTTSSTPARTTAAAPPPPPASPAPARCYPLSNAGHCYEPGEYCRTSDHGASGVAGDGEAIKCEAVNGWRWEPV